MVREIVELGGMKYDEDDGSEKIGFSFGIPRDCGGLTINISIRQMRIYS